MRKITERMILARITWQLEYKKQADGEEPAFSSVQTGFRPGLATVDSIALIHKDILARPPNMYPRTIVAVDIKKAFDTVPHDAVVQGAINRGLKGRCLEFVKSFLEDRTYEVVSGKNMDQRGRT